MKNKNLKARLEELAQETVEVCKFYRDYKNNYERGILDGEGDFAKEILCKLALHDLSYVFQFCKERKTESTKKQSVLVEEGSFFSYEDGYFDGIIRKCDVFIAMFRREGAMA